MSLNWYDDYKKKDFLIENPNKYTVAQAVNQPERKPYYIVMIRQDEDRFIPSLKKTPQWAFSKEQARLLFLKKYPVVKDILNMGIPVEARFHDEVWQEELKKRQNAKESIEKKEKRKQEQLEMRWDRNY